VGLNVTDIINEGDVLGGTKATKQSKLHTTDMLANQLLYGHRN
jgi:hypothetical protein